MLLELVFCSVCMRDSSVHTELVCQLFGRFAYGTSCNVVVCSSKAKNCLFLISK